MQTFIHSARASARAHMRAQVALTLDEGWNLAEVYRTFDLCRNTVINLRARFAAGGTTSRVRSATRRP